MLATAWWDGTVKVLAAESGRLIQTLRTDSGRGVNWIAITPDGTRLISGQIDGAMQIWEMGSWKKLNVLAHDASVDSIAASPDSQTLAYYLLHGPVQILSLPTGKTDTKLNEAFTRAVAFSPSGSMLACGGQDGVVWIFETGQWQPVRQWSGHGSSVMAVKFIGGDDVLCSIGRNDSIKLWDAVSGKLKRSYPVTGDIMAMDVSPSGDSVAIGGRFPGSLRIINLSTGREKRLTKSSWGMIEAIAYSPDGKTIAFTRGNTVITVRAPEW